MENVEIKQEKLVEEMTPEEQAKWLNEHVTRGEVTQFVSAYLNNEVIPFVFNSVGKELFNLRCRNELLLKFLVESGVFTSEQFEEEYKRYLSEQVKKLKEEQEKVKSDAEKSTLS